MDQILEILTSLHICDPRTALRIYSEWRGHAVDRGVSLQEIKHHEGGEGIMHERMREATPIGNNRWLCCRRLGESSSTRDLDLEERESHCSDCGKRHAYGR